MTSLYLFVEDLLPEGASATLAHLQDVLEVDSMTLAAAYHEARDVTPHGRTRVTVRQGGLNFFPQHGEFDGLELQPQVADVAGQGLVEAAVAAASDRGMRAQGWTVFCHSSAVGEANPLHTSRNCFGDAFSPGDLCPSSPAVQAYCVALGRAVAGAGFDTVVAESLGFGTFGHGYHHERAFLALGPADDFLLGVCFCEHCVRSASSAGIDAEAVRQRVAGVLEGVLLGERTGPACTLAALDAYVGQQVVDYVLHRRTTVTALASAVAAAVREAGARFCYLDVSGAVKGYGDGRPQGAPAAEDAWVIGVDPAAVSGVCDAYSTLAYASDPARVQADVAAYRSVLAPGCELRASLRPMLPDTDGPGSLAARAAAAVGAGADALDFYAYGLATRIALAQVPAAVRATSPG